MKPQISSNYVTFNQLGYIFTFTDGIATTSTPKAKLESISIHECILYISMNITYT